MIKVFNSRMQESFKKLAYPIGVILLINFLMHGCFLIAIERPLFYYEYLALPLVFTFLPNTKIRYFILTAVLILDAIISLARFYFFDSFNYISKIPSLFFSHFSFSFWIVLIFGLLLFAYFIYLIINQWGIITTDKVSKIFYAKFLIICLIVIYSIDIKTGNSYFNFKTIGNNHTNFSQSLIVQYYRDAKIFSKRYSSVSEMNDYKNGSLTYKYLKSDSSNHQLLIVLESWGYINNDSIRMEQIQDILQLNDKGYEVELDSSTFQGALHKQKQENY